MTQPDEPEDKIDPSEHLMVAQLLEQNLNLFYTNMTSRSQSEEEEATDTSEPPPKPSDS